MKLDTKKIREWAETKKSNIWHLEPDFEGLVIVKFYHITKLENGDCYELLIDVVDAEIFNMARIKPERRF
jgi:hypothetical protein